MMQIDHAVLATEILEVTQHPLSHTVLTDFREIDSGLWHTVYISSVGNRRFQSRPSLGTVHKAVLVRDV